MNKKLKIFIAHTLNKGTAQLRLIEPAEAMYNAGLIEKPKIASLTGFLKETEFFETADIVWFQGYLTQLFLSKLLEIRNNNPKIKLVFDMDDNLFALTKANPSYPAFCEEELIDLGGDTLYKCNAYGNRMSKRIAETMLIESDALICTTSLLANAYYKYNKNIYLMQNSLDWDNWFQPHVPFRDDGFIKLGWQGGNTHILDWVVVQEAVVKVLKENKNIKLEMLTTPGIYEGFMVQFPKEQFSFRTFIDYDAHPWRMNVLKPDIGIIPLNEDEFSVCKSDLKFTEYAALKIPVVASNIPPYNQSIVHGKTGFLASNTEEWVKYITLLAADPALRKEIGEAAFNWAKENRCLQTNAQAWYDIMKKISEEPSWQIPQAV